MLAAQVLGLGLGATAARAADTGHPPQHPDRALGTVVRASTGGDGPLDGPADGPADGALHGIRGTDGLDPADVVDGGDDGTRPAQDLGDALGHHLAGGELPLPGHQADRPDAFALAAGLLAAVPARPRPADPPRASRSDPAAHGRAPGGPGPASPVAPAAVPAPRAPADAPGP
ncbi:hypothetical protein, partial [Kitasatospora saccharophila]|uniref:hypothetical protein n=1 Tax=Kitasatospora saccharophila TaxID=407973 RepID=UPI0031E22FDD